ncbi:hypothetical protein ACFZCY_42120 [Streptomyces sp. NPDC007983]|uniref:hypothetical protein n=1 Tax=Streptomyces sp. NPDC007983 TaxID=3364800 RepID=UPI0036EC0F72
MLNLLVLMPDIPGLSDGLGWTGGTLVAAGVALMSQFHYSVAQLMSIGVLSGASNR